MEKTQKKILVVTGEPSGDHHGALVVDALKKNLPSLHIYGVGGEELIKSGMEILFHIRELSVVGLWEVFSHGGHILRAFRILKEQIRQSPPDLVLLIDYPEFNLRIAKFAKKHGVPVLYYISPQVWAWRKWRAKNPGLY